MIGSETKNPWDLYSEIPGWEKAEAALNDALADALALLDDKMNQGKMIPSAAARAAWNRMENVLPKYANYGSMDSEPRSYLAARITEHMQTKWHQTHFEMDRFGDV